MPQNALPWTVAVGPTGQPTALKTDANGRLLTVNAAAESSALNVTAAAVIKATPGTLGKFIVVTAPGTSGALTFNDCASVGAATTANEVYSIAYTAATAGLVVNIDFPCAVGIVVSAVGGGTPQYSVSYT